MQIRQLQIANDHVQDRLVLRVATQADEEYRIWFTRRFLRELWPHLADTLGKQADPAPLAMAEIPAEAASFDQPFAEENVTYPLGMTPLLTNEVKCDTLNDGTFNLTFREGRERSFQLGLTTDLLLALCAMLRAGAEHAQWNLALDYAAAPASTAPATGHHSRLH
jgi:hypothetical protein